MHLGPAKSALLWAFIATALFAGWQQLTVSRNFSGNWTALFCTGSQQRIPPSLRQGTYLVPHPIGFDGQFYRYVAHDPFLNHGFSEYLDNAPLRARRILVPVAAWSIAVGQQDWIDTAYISLFLVGCFAGTYWIARYLGSVSASQSWSLSFLALPATLIATDRLVVDMPAAALCAGLIWYQRSKQDLMLFLCLVLSCLCRETGIIFPAAFSLSALLARSFRKSLCFAASVLPTLAWYGYVQFRLGRADLPAWFGRMKEFSPLAVLMHPFPYPLPPVIASVAQVLDSSAVIGMLLALVLAAFYGFKSLLDPLRLTSLLFAISALLTLDRIVWETSYNFSRIFSPLLLILLLHGFSSGKRLLWASPVLLIDPRIVLQLSPQIAGVFGVRFAI